MTATTGTRHGANDGPAPTLMAGQVPVAFSFKRQRVRLLDVRGIDCREHFFRQTVERWAADHPDRATVELDFDTFVSAARRASLPAPAGFIFNVARCGSTLLANMLDALPAAVVLKESTTVAILLRRLLAAPTPAECRQLEALLTAALPLFGRMAEPPPVGPTDCAATGLPPLPRLFVKPHSSLTVAASTLLRLFPETPAIFLYREPGEVVASMLAKPPYGGLHDLPREQIIPGFPSLAHAPVNLSPARFHAHLWRSPVEEALMLPPYRLLFLDYADLVSNPPAAIERLTGHLGIRPSPETVAQMSAVMRVYAKDDTGRAPFEATGVHRRPPLDAAQRAEVHDVVGDLYAQLTARQAQAETAGSPGRTADRCSIADTTENDRADKEPPCTSFAYVR